MRRSQWALLCAAALLVPAGCQSLTQPVMTGGHDAKSAVSTRAAPPDPATTPLGEQVVKQITQPIAPVRIDRDTLDAVSMDTLWATPLPGETVKNMWLIEGQLYVESATSRLYCINPENGYVKWVYSLRSAITGHPSIAKDGLYVVAENIIHCIDPETGMAFWRARPEFLIASAPYVDDAVYVGGWDYGFYSLPKKDKFWKWRIGSGGVITARGYVSGVAYFASEDGRVYAYSSAKRAGVWDFDTGGRIRADVLGEGSLLYVGSGSFSVYALDMGNGRPKWRFRCEGPIVRNLQLAADAVYATADKDGLYAIDKPSGAMKWFVPDGVTLAALTPDKAYVGTADNSLCAVDRSSGKILWKQFGPLFRGYCPGAASYLVFALSSSGQIVALRQRGLSGIAAAKEVPKEPGKEPPKQPGKEPAPKTTDSPFAMIPKDVDAVIKVDLRKLLAVPLVKQGIENPAAAGGMEQIQEMGIDPEKDLASLCLGVNMAGAAPRVFAVLLGQFDPVKIEAAAKDAGQLKETLDHKGVKILVAGGEQPGAVGLVSTTAVAFAMTPDDVKAMIDLATGGAGNVLENKTLSTLTSGFATPATIWAAIVLNDKVKEQLAANPMSLPFLQAKSALLAINMPEGGLDVSLAADCESADGATGIATALSGLKGLVGASMTGPDGKPTPEATALMEAIKVAADGTKATVKVNITGDMIGKLIGAAMMGGPAPKPEGEPKPEAPKPEAEKPKAGE